MLLGLRKIFANEYQYYFSKNYVLKKGKILMFFGKEIKQKVAIRMHYQQYTYQAEIYILLKTTSEPEFFL